MVEWRSIFEVYSIFKWLAILSKTIPNPNEKIQYLQNGSHFENYPLKNRITKMFGIRIDSVFGCSVFGSPLYYRSATFFGGTKNKNKDQKNVLKQKHANHDFR